MKEIFIWKNWERCTCCNIGWRPKNKRQLRGIFFNEFKMREFSREDFVAMLQNYTKEQNVEQPPLRSLNEDFQCIVNTYLPRYKLNATEISPENNIDCPFGEIGLIDIVDRQKKIYRKMIPPVGTLNPYVILAVIVDNAQGQKEISFDKLLNSPCNIGKVFNLDYVNLLDVLYKIENLKLLRIKRTAGLDVVTLQNKLNFWDCVNFFYDSIGRQAGVIK